MSDLKLVLHHIEDALMAYCAMSVSPTTGEAGRELVESKREGFRQMLSALRKKLDATPPPPVAGSSEPNALEACGCPGCKDALRQIQDRDKVETLVARLQTVTDALQAADEQLDHAEAELSRLRSQGTQARRLAERAAELPDRWFKGNPLLPGGKLVMDSPMVDAEWLKQAVKVLAELAALFPEPSAHEVKP